MKKKKSLIYLILIALTSCAGNSQLTEFEDISKEVAKHITVNAREDDVKIKSLKVNINNLDGVKKLNIFWEINEYPYTEFIFEYNTMLIRNLNPDIINSVDSVILEVQMPDSSFGLKRYRASSEEVYNLRKEYQDIDSLYIPILKYIMRAKSIQILPQFDDIIENFKQREYALMDTSYWEHGSFLGYLKSDLLIDYKDSIKNRNKIEIFKITFGQSTFFFNSRKPYDMVNFILSELGEEPLNYSQKDTATFGFKPTWLEVESK